MAESLRFVGNCTPPREVNMKKQIDDPDIQDLADNLAKKLIGHGYDRKDGVYVPVKITVIVDVVPASVY